MKGTTLLDSPIIEEHKLHFGRKGWSEVESQTFLALGSYGNLMGE
jgi:hypothetical protein